MEKYCYENCIISKNQSLVFQFFKGNQKKIKSGQSNKNEGKALLKLRLNSKYIKEVAIILTYSQQSE